MVHLIFLKIENSYQIRLITYKTSACSWALAQLFLSLFTELDIT